MPERDAGAGGRERYGATARWLHWAVVALIVAQVPIALWMTSRSEARIEDDLTAVLYSSHKLIGLTILAVVVLRVLDRLTHGVPHHEPTIAPWQRVASRLNHWSMYVLLLVVPLLGWLGVSYYPALNVGLFSLPGLVAPLEPKKATEDMAHEVFEWHELAAFALIALVAVHVLAALYHRFVRRDGVLPRMWPGA